MPPDSPFSKAVLEGTFSFTARPEPVAGDLRMAWGISILLLSLLHSHGRKGSFRKLQFLAHAVRLPEGRDDVRSLFRGDLHSSQISVRVEPWLNRAVSFAHALGLVDVVKGKSVALSQKGKSAATAINSKPDVLVEERAFIAEFAPRLTEALLTKIWRMEDLL